MLRFVLPVAFLVLAGCAPGDKGAGAPASRTYNLAGFTRVKAEAGIDLRLAQGQFAVAAESRNADLSRLKVEVQGEQLRISSQTSFTLGASPTYVVSVTAPTYKAIEASAGVKIEGDGLQLEDVSVDISAGVDARLSGSCKALTADISAGAVLKAEDLKCASATVSAAAGAVAEVFATDEAKASASAGAKVSVYGHPKSVERSADIAGVVEVKN